MYSTYGLIWEAVLNTHRKWPCCLRLLLWFTAAFSLSNASCALQRDDLRVIVVRAAVNRRLRLTGLGFLLLSLFCHHTFLLNCLIWVSLLSHYFSFTLLFDLYHVLFIFSPCIEPDLALESAFSRQHLQSLLLLIIIRDIGLHSQACSATMLSQIYFFNFLLLNLMLCSIKWKKSSVKRLS